MAELNRCTSCVRCEVGGGAFLFPLCLSRQGLTYVRTQEHVLFRGKEEDSVLWGRGGSVVRNISEKCLVFVCQTPLKNLSLFFPFPPFLKRIISISTFSPYKKKAATTNVRTLKVFRRCVDKASQGKNPRLSQKSGRARENFRGRLFFPFFCSSLCFSRPVPPLPWMSSARDKPADSQLCLKSGTEARFFSVSPLPSAELHPGTMYVLPKLRCILRCGSWWPSLSYRLRERSVVTSLNYAILIPSHPFFCRYILAKFMQQGHLPMHRNAQ